MSGRAISAFEITQPGACSEWYAGLVHDGMLASAAKVVEAMSKMQEIGLVEGNESKDDHGIDGLVAAALTFASNPSENNVRNFNKAKRVHMAALGEEGESIIERGAKAAKRGDGSDLSSRARVTPMHGYNLRSTNNQQKRG